MKIVLATDGSQGSLVAARFIAANFSPDAVSADVVTVEDWPPAEDTWVVREIYETAPAPADSPIQAAARALADAGFRTTGTVLSGHAAEAIAAFARATGADLLVLGSRGLHGWRRVVAGSVSSAVARASTVPVLVAGSEARVERAVVGYDASAACEAAIDVATHLPFLVEPAFLVCAAYEASAPLASGIAPTLIAAVEESYSAELRATKARAEEWAACAAQALAAEGVPATTVVRHGRPVEILLEASEPHATSLLVVGSKEHTALHRLLLGSTTSGVLGAGHLNVLVAHAGAGCGT